MSKSFDESQSAHNEYEPLSSRVEAELTEGERGIGWISVQERLPDLDVEVLISFVNPTGSTPSIPRTSTGTWCKDFTNEPHWVDPANTANSYDHLLITHWQPLPDPHRERV